MNRIRRRAALLAAVFAAVWLFSCAFIAVCGDHSCEKVCSCPEHDCPHNDCRVCSAVSACRSILAGLAAASASTAALLWLRGRNTGGKPACGAVCATPVTLHTRLLC